MSTNIYISMVQVAPVTVFRTAVSLIDAFPALIHQRVLSVLPRHGHHNMQIPTPLNHLVEIILLYDVILYIVIIYNTIHWYIILYHLLLYYTRISIVILY